MQYTKLNSTLTQGMVLCVFFNTFRLYIYVLLLNISLLDSPSTFHFKFGFVCLSSCLLKLLTNVQWNPSHIIRMKPVCISSNGYDFVLFVKSYFLLTISNMFLIFTTILIFVCVREWGSLILLIWLLSYLWFNGKNKSTS